MVTKLLNTLGLLPPPREDLEAAMWRAWETDRDRAETLGRVARSGRHVLFEPNADNSRKTNGASRASR